GGWRFGHWFPWSGERRVAAPWQPCLSEREVPHGRAPARAADGRRHRLPEPAGVATRESREGSCRLLRASPAWLSPYPAQGWSGPAGRWEYRPAGREAAVPWPPPDGLRGRPSAPGSAARAWPGFDLRWRLGDPPDAVSGWPRRAGVANARRSRFV